MHSYLIFFNKLFKSDYRAYISIKESMHTFISLGRQRTTLEYVIHVHWNPGLTLIEKFYQPVITLKSILDKKLILVAIRNFSGQTLVNDCNKLFLCLLIVLDTLSFSRTLQSICHMQY